MGLVRRSSQNVYHYCICFLPQRRLPSETRASSLLIKSCVLSVGCWKLICTRFALIEVSWLVNIKWFYWVNVDHGCTLRMRCSSWQHAQVTCLPQDAALVWSFWPPWAGISLVIKEAVVYEKKKNGAYRSQSPFLAPPWGMDTIWPSWNDDELGIHLC